MREEMGYPDVASKSRTKLRRGACAWQRLCSDRLLIVAVFFIVILWSLLVVFVALFIARPGDRGTSGQGSIVPNSSIAPNACQAEVYLGTECRSTLSAMSLGCGITEDANGNVYISTQGGDQTDIGTQVLMLSNGLQLLNPSLECEEAVLPFLCLFAFPLCDSSGELYQTSLGECETLTTETCAREWQMALLFLGSENLPQCNTLPVTSLQCNGSSAINRSDSAGNRTEIVCSTDFYLDMEDNTCKAECGKWKLYNSDKLETAMTTLIIVATVVGIIGGSIVLILSCINYKKAFAFPSVFVRYEVAIVMAYNVVVLISLIGDRNLFCSSQNLFASTKESTQYCTFTAVLFYYVYIQLSTLWILHIGAIFWGLTFPFQAHRFDVTGKYKYLHFAAILLAIIIPGITVAGSLGPEGVEFQRYPPIICAADSRNGNFYSTLLPIAISDVVGCTLLALIFWTIHKNSRITDTAIHRKRTPEVKVLIIICYFLGIGIFSLIVFCVSFRNTVPQFRQHLSEYLLCESIGTRLDNSCADERRSLNNAVIMQFLFDIAYILLGSFPAVNLIYAVNYSDLKQKCKERFPDWFARTQENVDVLNFTTQTVL